MGAREAAQSFEGSLMILRKDKNGWVFGFSVHPSEAPTPLLDAPLGTRFQCVMFEIGDDESLVVRPSPEKGPGDKAVSLAGMLCRDTRFMDWTGSKFYMFRDPSEMKLNNPPDEGECSHLLKSALGIGSRSELSTNEDARESFESIVKEYNQFLSWGEVE